MTFSVIFVGTRPLAARCLEYLAQAQKVFDIKIVGVLTLSSCNHKWWRTEGKLVSEVAKNFKLKLITPSELQCIKSVDYIICIYWHQIFKTDLINKVKFSFINLHTAPLPNYRGCHGYSHAILNGEKEYGTTLHLLTEGIDKGKIIDKVMFPITRKDTARSLYDKAVEYSFGMFCYNIPKIFSGKITLTDQAEIKGVKTNYYNISSLDKYLNSSPAIQEQVNSEVLYKALYFPPDFMPPKWIKDYENN